MRAYHNDPTLKQYLLDQLAEHRRLDHLVKGMYAGGEGDNFRGCAIGCCLEAIRRRNGKYANGINHADHALLSKELGIPEPLLHLQDTLFEGLPAPDYLDWPYQFADAITPGADLSHVWPQFAIALLTDPAGPVWPQVQEPRWVPQKQAIEAVADCYRRQATAEEFKTAAESARAVANRTATQAPWAAAVTAAAAADTAGMSTMVWAAERAAANTAAWASANGTACWGGAYRWQRDLLLKLLRGV